MEFIWQRCPKTEKDGEEYVVYEPTDIPALYYSGLVDTHRFKLKHWEQAFEDCLGKDGRYWVSHNKMMFLGMFRDSKRVGEPFDPLKMRIGKYTPERLWQVFEKSIIPSCSLGEDFVKRVFEGHILRNKSAREILGKDVDQAIKKEKIDTGVADEDFDIHAGAIAGADGKKYVEVTREFLENIKNIIDSYPSPRRKMELGVQEVRLGKLQKLSGQAAQSQKSTFEAGKDFRETTQEDLKEMLVKASDKPTGGRKPSGEELDLKKMQKKKPKPTKF
jgi:hypothetical protein